MLGVGLLLKTEEIFVIQSEETNSRVGGEGNGRVTRNTKKDTDAEDARNKKKTIYDKEDMSYWRKDRKLTKRGMNMEILKMKKEPEMEEKRQQTERRVKK